MIHLYWFIITLGILLWGSYEDLTNRLIQDRVWLTFIILSLPSYIYWVNTIASYDDKLISFINILFTIIITFFLFSGGSLAGGDAKALLIIPLTTPITFWEPDIPYLDQSPLLSVFLLLFIFAVLMILFALSLLIRNLIEIKQYGKLFGKTEGNFLAKINVLISSRRVEFNKIHKLKHSDPAEIYDLGAWRLYAPIFPGFIDDDEAFKLEKEMREKALNDAKLTNREYIWFRPQPPGLMFLTLAYIIWAIIGGPYSILT